MNITYTINTTINGEELAQLFLSSGISRPTDQVIRLEKMIQHADEIVIAREGEKLVGVLRAVTDYHYCCYISDLAVDMAYQGNGIGEKLMAMLQQKLGNEEVQYILVSAPTAVGFYERLGMERLDKAFVIRRQK